MPYKGVIKWRQGQVPSEGESLEAVLDPVKGRLAFDCYFRPKDTHYRGIELFKRIERDEFKETEIEWWEGSAPAYRIKEIKVKASHDGQTLILQGHWVEFGDTWNVEIKLDPT